MKKIHLRTPFNFDRDKSTRRTGLTCHDKTLAQQQFTEECDINTLVDRYHLTGEMPQLTTLPTYGDFTGIFDYQSAMNAIVAARETFMTLPAKIRARFHNDPNEFVEFCSDDDNYPEARRMGLLKEEATPPAPPPAKEPTEAPDKPKGGKKAPTKPADNPDPNNTGGL